MTIQGAFMGAYRETYNCSCSPEEIGKTELYYPIYDLCLVVSSHVAIDHKLLVENLNYKILQVGNGFHSI